MDPERKIDVPSGGVAEKLDAPNTTANSARKDDAKSQKDGDPDKPEVCYPSSSS